MDERTNALPVGTELEGYRVVALLGAGGFGITYKAVDLLLDRPVAIKEYLPSALANRSVDRRGVQAFGRQEQEQFAWGLERFRSEAKTLVAFQHSHIVPVHRYFEANGTGYLVMAFQDGKSLADVIDAVGTLSEDELLTILRPLAAGLADVHAKGFLHRDIKPANIIIRRDGTPVLIDFGAARQAVSRQSRGLTAIVTEGYAPYEQYETDSHQGAWTDIYALGAVLYHCVTGHRPPEAPKRIAAKLRRQPEPMMPARQAAAGNYSESLLAAIDRALEVEEDKRPQSVAEFMRMVERGDQSSPLEEDAALGAATSYMVDPPSQPPGEIAHTGRTFEPTSAELAGNPMVEPPSAGLPRRAPKPAPPSVPLISRSHAPASARAAEPSPAFDTLTVGGPTLIVGGEPDALAAANRAETDQSDEGDADDAAPPSAAPVRRRRLLPILAGAVAAVALAGGGIAYFTQLQRSSPPAVTEKTNASPTETAPPTAPRMSDEVAARSRAAAPAQTWEHLAVKTGQDVVRRIFVLANDELLIAGGRIDAEGINSDAWLWRFDGAKGAPVADRKTFGNARFDSGNAVTVFPDGGVVLAAARRSGGTNAVVAWVARLSPEGATVWEHNFADRPLIVPYGITALPNGDIVVVGAAGAGDKPGTTYGWAARLSQDGKVMWEKTFGAGIDDSLQAVAVLRDGGIVAVGWTNVERPAGDDRNLWIMALDLDGKLRWDKKDLGDTADEKGKSVLVADDGDILVLAEASRVPAPPPGRPGRVPPREFDTSPIHKPWLLRLAAADGTVRWDKRYSGGKDDKSDSLDAIAAAGDGGFVLAGSTESKGAGRKDGWLLRVDADGNQLWDQHFGEQFDDEFTALTPLLDGGVLLGGSTIKIEASASAAGRPQGEPKLWLLRLGYR